MAPITESMVRRRAEHNDGVLETLEELVLQEEGIDKIEILGRLCPNLKLLYMPNNLIPRIENISRLKSLEYLNLTLNNIVKVEGLQGCEVLNKLDLTLNFVDKENLPTLLNLQANIHLTELFLTGNPCTDFDGYRKYVIAAVPSLMRLDAFTIKPSEKIAAQQEFSEIQKKLLPFNNALDSSPSHTKQHQEVNEKGQLVREYSVATRVAEHMEMQDARGEAKQESNAKEHKSKRRKGFDPLPTEGRIFQKNEGGWDFRLNESNCGRFVLLDIEVGRYLDTSLIDVDIHPTIARILVKGKLLQLKLPCEVKVDESKIQRSSTTGHLLLTFPKLVPDSYLHSICSYVVPHIKQTLSNSKMTQPPILPRKQVTHERGLDVVNISCILEEGNPQEVPKLQVVDSLTKTSLESLSSTLPTPCDDTDFTTWDDDVPPLE